MAVQRAPLPILLSEPDAALARRAGRGDGIAFEVLVGRHRDALGRFCRALLRNPEDAEDALQGTLLRAYRGLARVDRPTAVRAWLLRIARNECLRVAGARSGTEPLGAEPPTEARLTERVVARDDLRVLGGDLRALPERQRSAIVLREICGLSHRQAADVIGVTPEAVRHLVNDARRTLESFGAGRELDCADVRSRIAAGDGRVLRARAVGAHLRACEACRAERARARRPLAALLPPLPAALAGRWFGVKVAAGTLAGAAVVTGALVVSGLQPPGRGGQAEAAPARPAAAAGPAAPAAPVTAAAKPAPRPPVAEAAPPSGTRGPDPATPAPEPAAEQVPADPAPAGAPAPSGPAAAAPASAAAVPLPPPSSAAAPAAAPAPAPVVQASVVTAPVSATVAVGSGGVTAGTQVTTPALPALAPVGASAQVSVDPAPDPGTPLVDATVDTGLLPPLRVALP